MLLCMKTKTSVSLSTELLDRISEITTVGNRSDFIEKALWQYLEFIRRQKCNVQDMAIINRNAEQLNTEALDVLEYQYIDV
ncbi:hypothetical protein FACS1894164_16300 [Spirochaetia bacterium]|nr:hypothetical protein FACS1894164_16300 [Spirochaetia bacterium]